MRSRKKQEAPSALHSAIGRRTVLRGMAAGPRLIRRAALVLPLYFALLLVIGYWCEIRYWITAIPIVVPALIAAALRTLHPASVPADEERADAARARSSATVARDSRFATWC